MNGRIDVIEVLRQVNPVPRGTIDERAHPTAAELLASLRASSNSAPTLRLDQPAPRAQSRWPKYAAAAVALAAGITALSLVPSGQEGPVVPATSPETTTSLPPTSPFVGIWLSTDADGSSQTMEILGSGFDEHEVVVRDEAATGACSGGPSTMTGIGRVAADRSLVIVQPKLTCDDGTTPAIGPPPQLELANFTFVRDADNDDLVDMFGVVWRREGAPNAGDPAPSVSPSVGPSAAQEEVIGLLVDAVNAAAADDTRDEASLPDVFAADATIIPQEGWGERPVTEPDLLGAWIRHLQAWGFEGDVHLRECWTEDLVVICTVRARWHTVLAEADEYWGFDFDDDRIRSLNIRGQGERSGNAVLPLSLAELDDWEDWLRQTDPETAATLLHTADASRPLPVVPRYAPALADEITASIQLYLSQRGPGDEISVTADFVEFGDRLVGLIGNMARADGRTYVIAGRYQTEGDLLFAPEKAVLAAFDDAGGELWRTELDGTPVAVVAVAGDVWVSHSVGRLSRIDASNGHVVDQMNIENIASMVGAFESLWVQTGDSVGPLQLTRVDPDMSTTTVVLPPHDMVDGDDCCLQGPTAGAGAIWEPLRDHGVAMIDPDTLEVTVIPGDEIGHDVIQVAVEGDVAYVASRNQVTSIVDGEVRATASTGEIQYLGRVDGVFGMVHPDRRFTVLTATDPMVGDARQLSETGGMREIDGEAWVETGRNYNLRRVELLPVPEAGGG